MIQKLINKLQFNISDRLRFYRIMSRATDEAKYGVKPLTVLLNLAKIEEKRNKGKKTIHSKLYRKWAEQIELGKRLGEIMKDYVPESEASQIYASDESGNISQGFLLAMEVAKQQHTFTKVFREALIGPLLNLAISLGVLVGFFNMLVPSIASSVPEDKMSPFSHLLYIIAQNFTNWFSIFITIGAFTMIWVIWALPNYNGFLRKKLDFFPPFSLYKIMVGCSFLFALMALMKSRIAQNKALEMINKFSSPYLKFRIDRILLQTEKSLGEALINLNLDFPAREVIDELAMASAQGNVNQALPSVVANLAEDGLDLIKLHANVAQVFTKMITVALLALLIFGQMSFVVDIQNMTGGLH